MNTIKNILILLLGTCLGLSACSEDKLAPIVEDNRIPQQVTNIQVTPLPGGAKITYDVPADPVLHYVEARYQLKSGEWQSVKASHYGDSLLLYGFGDTTNYVIQLSSVSKSERRSESQSIHVKPLPPPIWDIFESFQMAADFGGITVNFSNSREAEVAITLLTSDQSTNGVEVSEVFYTKQRSGDLAFRGLDTATRLFKAFVRDRWGNVSDTLAMTLTPLFEQKLDKSKFSPVTSLPGEPEWWSYGPMTNLWTENLSDGNYAGQQAWFRTANGAGLVHHFTFDLGVVAKLSRYQQWQRGVISEHSLLYANGNPRRWEVWGSTDPAPDGSYNGWVKLLDCENVKPSNLPLGNNSNEDIAAAQAGQEFKIPLDAPPVRFIRIKILETWAKTDFSHISEVTFFGSVEK